MPSHRQQNGELPLCAVMWKVACKHQIALKDVGLTQDRTFKLKR